MNKSDDGGAKGRFVMAGNARKPGRAGKYNPHRIEAACKGYLVQQDIVGKPYSWSGLAKYMGISTLALDQYYRGMVGEDKQGIVQVLEYMKTVLEVQEEDRLFEESRLN